MDELNFKIGALVHCRDGQCGKLFKLVVNPDTLQVTDLIVGEGFLLKRARVFPISTVETSTEDDIYLSITGADLSGFREYREVEYDELLPNWSTASPITVEDALSRRSVPMIRRKIREGLASEELRLIERGTQVENSEGIIGKVDHVVVDAGTRKITHLIVRHGFIFPEQLDIPAALVDHVAEEHILIAATNKTLKQLSG